MYTSLSIPCSSLIFIPPRVEISIEIAAVLKAAFEAIWTAPGRLLASTLDQNGVDFGPPVAVARDPANQKQRRAQGEPPGGPKGSPRGGSNIQKRVEISTEIAAVLKTAFEAIWTAPGRLLASMLDQVGGDFGPPGAGKQDPANQKQQARF